MKNGKKSAKSLMFSAGGDVSKADRGGYFALKSQ
jgi:hypothetical protein